MSSRKQALEFARDWLLVPGALVFLAGTAYVYIYWHTVTILEYRETQGFKAVELRQPRSDVVRISGLAGHSALAVKKITRERDASSIVVLVHLFMTRHGRTGSFVYDVPVPDSVTEIRYGTKRVVIWKRPATGNTVAGVHQTDSQRTLSF